MKVRTRPVVVLAALAVAGVAVAQSIQRDSFDGREVQWAKGPANVPANEEAHILTNQHAHSLPTSEYVRIKADANGELNPYVYYSYPTRAAPVSDDMPGEAGRAAYRPLARRGVHGHRRVLAGAGNPPAGQAAQG
jgi:hypothetical protein